ncbi:MAG: hypothetical protein Q9168_004472, partial [Polycauliona sp. 1 TL-2023]
PRGLQLVLTAVEVEACDEDVRLDVLDMDVEVTLALGVVDELVLDNVLDPLLVVLVEVVVWEVKIREFEDIELDKDELDDVGIKDVDLEEVEVKDVEVEDLDVGVPGVDVVEDVEIDVAVVDVLVVVGADVEVDDVDVELCEVEDDEELLQGTASQLGWYFEES